MRPQFKCIENLNLNNNINLGAVGIKAIASVRRRGREALQPHLLTCNASSPLCWALTHVSAAHFPCTSPVFSRIP